jgi:RNA polymerase primary sigma factor
MSKRFETSSSLPAYFREVSQCSKPLSKADERALAVRIQAGDDLALNELVQANLKFAVTLANKFVGMGLSVDDLIQEANSGLIEAARRFGPDKDVKFITYAQFWIRKRLNGALCEYGRTVRIPVNQEYDIYKRKMAGEATPNLNNVKLDRPVGDDGDHTLGDLLLRTNAVDPFEDDEQASVLRFLLGKLTAKERQIVELFYGLDDESRSTKEVAELVGLSAVEVNRALKVARAKMRKSAGVK